MARSGELNRMFTDKQSAGKQKTTGKKFSFEALLKCVE